MDFIFSNFSLTHIASQYGDECNDDEQCTPLLGDLGTCEQNQCVCNEALQYNNGKCHEKKSMYH